jgi:formamidopyrimidine-DNA glycosylase
MFGLLVRGKLEQLRKYPSFSALGPDPLPGIDADRLYAVLKKTRRSLKEALMDQRVLAGLGNIYVSEALHRARLNPQRRGTSLTRVETGRLVEAIDESLRNALDEEESDEPITYVEEGGENFFLVYDRAGQPCKRCRTPIQRIVQGGRSTYFCPHCQPRRPGRR